jgi:hypothetical protein
MKLMLYDTKYVRYRKYEDVPWNGGEAVHSYYLSLHRYTWWASRSGHCIPVPTQKDAAWCRTLSGHSCDIDNSASNTIKKLFRKKPLALVTELSPLPLWHVPIYFIVIFIKFEFCLQVKAEEIGTKSKHIRQVSKRGINTKLNQNM